MFLVLISIILFAIIDLALGELGGIKYGHRVFSLLLGFLGIDPENHTLFNFF